MNVLETTLLFSVLQSSRIEGIEEHAQKFIKMFQRVSNQPYDPINYRREEFDAEFEAFKRSQVDAEEALYKFMRCSLQCCPDIHSELRLITRCLYSTLERLSLPTEMIVIGRQINTTDYILRARETLPS